MKIINFKTVISVVLSFAVMASAYADERSLVSINAKAYGLYLKGSYGSAYAVYKKGLNLYPHSASLYDGIGAVYLKKNQYFQAYKNFNRASQIDDSDSIYKLHAYEAIYESNLNKINSARHMISLAFGISAGNSVIRKNFQSVRDNKFRNLETIYYVCQNQNDVNLTKGNIAFWNNDYRKAEQFYQKSIKQQPKNYEALNNLGLVYFETGSIANAVCNFRKAANLNTRLPQAFNNLGVAYMKAGNWTESNKNFDSAIRTGKNYFPAYNNKAVCLTKSIFDNINKPVKYLETIVRQEPANILAKETLGMFLLLDENYNEAVNVYKSGLDLTQNNFSYLKQYADCLYAAEKYQEAINVYRKAVLINADNSDIFVSMARAYDKNNEDQDAFASFQTALRINPKNTNAYKYFGLYLLSQKRNAEAKVLLKKYVKSSPYSYDCVYIKKLI